MILLDFVFESRDLSIAIANPIAIGWPPGSLTTERSAVLTPHRALVVMSYISHM